MKYIKVLQKHRDVADKWYVRVAVSKDEAIFLKFAKNPTSEVVRREVNKFIENKQKERMRELEFINRKIKEMRKRKKSLQSVVASHKSVMGLSPLRR